MIGTFPLPRAPLGAAPPPTELSEEEICEALAAGELWATDVFYDRVEDTVQAVLYCMLGATEINQDDLMRLALEQLIAGAIARRFSPRCSFKAWVALVTQQVALDALRARVRNRAVIDRSLEPGTRVVATTTTEYAPDRAPEVQQRLEALLDALGRAKPARAEAVVLHDVLGYELTEISSLTGVSLAQVQSRLLRGRHDVGSLIEAGPSRSAR